MSPGPTPLSVTVIKYSEMAPTRTVCHPSGVSPDKHFFEVRYQSDWTPEQAERFHMTSRRPYWFFKTMKRLPCWVSQTNPVGVELFLSLLFAGYVLFPHANSSDLPSRIIWSWEKLLKIRRHFPFGNHFQVNSRNLLFYYYLFILLGEKWCWSLWNWRRQNCLIPSGINV